MESAYEDIMGLRRPVHRDDPFARRHPKMDRGNRAKLFAPFAALTGFDDVVHAMAVQCGELPPEEISDQARRKA